MGTEHHELFGRLGALDDPEDVGALVEGVEEAVAAREGIGDQLQLVHEPFLRPPGSLRLVVASVRLLHEVRQRLGPGLVGPVGGCRGRRLPGRSTLIRAAVTARGHGGQGGQGHEDAGGAS